METIYPVLNPAYVLVRCCNRSIIYPLSNNGEVGYARPDYEYLTINKVAAEILELSNGENSVSQIAHILSQFYGEAYEQAYAFVKDFVLSCKESGLVTLQEKALKKTIRIAGDYSVVTPINACFEITKRCPLKCIHCYNDSGIKKAYEMNLEEVKTVLQKLSMLGVQKLMITGGEPLMRSDFIEIIDYAYPRFIAISIASNGYLMTDSLAQSLAKYKDKIVVQISVDGIEVHHNKIRGLSDSFEKAVNAIRLLRQNEIPTIVATTLNSDNFSDMESVAQIVYEAGALQLSFAITTSQGRARDNHIAYGIDMEQFLSRLKCLYKIYIEKGMYIQMDPETVGEKLQVNSRGCGAGISQIAVRENGDVSPCLCFFYTYGNLLKEEITQIFSYENVACFESLLRPNKSLCGGCEEYENCQGCPARAYDSIKKDCPWKESFKNEVENRRR